MSKVRICPVCGMPRHVSKQINWRENGTMFQRRNPDHRSVFIESENIDGVFRGIEEIIEHPIEHIIVESRSRSSADYLRHILPGAVRTLLRVIGIKTVIRRMGDMIKALGYGDLEVLSVRWKGDEYDNLTLLVRDPYSLPLMCGDIAGFVQVVDGREITIAYEQKSPLEYELHCFVTPRAKELGERLAWRSYAYKSGDIDLERCPRCGLPKALQRFEYNLDKGIVLSRGTGRRMVGIGPAALEAIFDELENEVGDTIPQVVIEAQRRFTASFYSREEIEGERDMRLHFAIRGLGNLRELDFSADSLRCRLENSCLHLMIVGLLQGYFELVYERPGEVDWKLKEDGDLLVVVSPSS